MPPYHAEAPEGWLPYAVRADQLELPFSCDGATMGQVLGQAEALGELLSGASPADRRLCVGSSDRLDVAAALLAAFTGRIQVLLPHGLAARALAELHEAHGFGWWLGPEEWQAEVPGTRIAPEPLRTRVPRAAYRIGDPDQHVVSLFTGGSTGQPRMWGKTARNLLGESSLQARVLGLGTEDRVLATVPPHHIYGVLFSVLAPMIAGARQERSTPFFPHEVCSRAQALGITLLVSAPVHLRALAAAEWPANPVRRVLSSGAPLLAPDAAAFHARTGHWPLEIFGSTETGGVATRWQGDPSPGWSLIEGVRMRISSERLAVDSPFLSAQLERDDEGYFLMGDGARKVGDRFELLGRTDGVVKVGGVRVDLAEIEQAVRALSGVSVGVALSRVTATGRGQQVVLVVETLRDSAEVLAEVRAKLPSAFWPRAAVCVPALPMTPSGKRDRVAMDRIIDEALA